MFKKIIIVLLLPLCSSGLLAQNQQLGELLNTMSKEQKVKFLTYIRSLSDNDLDQEIQCAYDQLPQIAQIRAMQYAESVQPSGSAQPLRTLVQWSRDTLHFGTIPAGKVIIDSVWVTNRGVRPYTISAHQSTCDCTVLKVPSQPLLPGESAIVRISFNSFGKVGKVSTGIVLQDNSTPNARTILYLTGEIKPETTTKRRPWEY